MNLRLLTLLVSSLKIRKIRNPSFVIIAHFIVTEVQQLSRSVGLTKSLSPVLGYACQAHQTVPTAGAGVSSTEHDRVHEQDAVLTAANSQRREEVPQGLWDEFA